MKFLSYTQNNNVTYIPETNVAAVTRSEGSWLIYLRSPVGTHNAQIRTNDQDDVANIEAWLKG